MVGRSYRSLGSEYGYEGCGLSKPEVTVYKCVICPASFTKQQSLAAHYRIHKDERFAELHVRLPKEKKEAFVEFCKRHNSTTCHMVLAMVDAYMEGDKRGLITVGSPNPAIVHIQQFFNAKPRGKGKYEPVPIPFGPLEEALRCDHLRHREFEEGRLGWCSKCGRMVTPSNCLGCVERGKKGPPSFQ